MELLRWNNGQYGGNYFEFVNIDSYVNDVFPISGKISLIRIIDKELSVFRKRFVKIKIDEIEYLEEDFNIGFIDPSSAYFHQYFDYTALNKLSFPISFEKGSSFYFESYKNTCEKVQLYLR